MTKKATTLAKKLFNYSRIIETSKILSVDGDIVTVKISTKLSKGEYVRSVYYKYNGNDNVFTLLTNMP